jgi:hypothetical protein
LTGVMEIDGVRREKKRRTVSKLMVLFVLLYYQII